MVVVKDCVYYVLGKFIRQVLGTILTHFEFSFLVQEIHRFSYVINSQPSPSKFFGSRLIQKSCVSPLLWTRSPIANATKQQ